MSITPNLCCDETELRSNHLLDNNNNLKKKKKNEAQLVLESSENHVGQTLQAPLEGSLPAVQSKWQEGLGLSRECMFLGSLSRHNKELE